MVKRGLWRDRLTCFTVYHRKRHHRPLLTHDELLFDIGAHAFRRGYRRVPKLVKVSVLHRLNQRGAMILGKRFKRSDGSIQNDGFRPEHLNLFAAYPVRGVDTCQFCPIEH
jgi:hypothetical protein